MSIICVGVWLHDIIAENRQKVGWRLWMTIRSNVVHIIISSCMRGFPTVFTKDIWKLDLHLITLCMTDCWWNLHAGSVSLFETKYLINTINFLYVQYFAGSMVQRKAFRENWPVSWYQQQGIWVWAGLRENSTTWFPRLWLEMDQPKLFSHRQIPCSVK